MFTIANEIAYNNKMIHGSDDFIERGEFIWGSSCWFALHGDAMGNKRDDLDYVGVNSARATSLFSSPP